MKSYNPNSANSSSLIQICNNGCWVIGDLANKVPEIIKQNIADLM